MMLSHYVPSSELFLTTTNSVRAHISIPQNFLRLSLELLSGLKPILIVLNMLPNWPSFANSSYRDNFSNRVLQLSLSNFQWTGNLGQIDALQNMEDIDASGAYKVMIPILVKVNLC